MVFGGNLERAWGSPQQRGCHRGIGSLFTPHLPVTGRGPVLGAPIETPVAAMAQQIAPGSSWRERTQVEGAQVPGDPRALGARGEPRGEDPRPAPGAQIATRHRPRKLCRWGHRRGQAGASDSLHGIFDLSEVCWGEAKLAAAAQRRAVAPSPEETSQEARFPRWPASRFLRDSARAPCLPDCP